MTITDTFTSLDISSKIGNITVQQTLLEKR